MNKHEQIEGHLTAIGYFSSPSGCWSFSKKVSRVQEELDAIKALLQPEPESESLAASVLRLTELCNTLEKKNYELSLELTQYRDGWFPCATVEELAKLRGCNNRLEQNLRVLEEEIVKQVRLHEAELTAADRKSEYLERARSANDAYIQRLSDEIKNLKRDLAKRDRDLDAAIRSNASLRRLLQSKRGLLENSEHALRHVLDQLETILEQTEP